MQTEIVCRTHQLMTDTELKAEWDYWYQESLAIQCADREPTPQQIDIAFREEVEHVNILKANQV